MIEDCVTTTSTNCFPAVTTWTGQPYTITGYAQLSAAIHFCENGFLVEFMGRKYLAENEAAVAKQLKEFKKTGDKT